MREPQETFCCSECGALYEVTRTRFEASVEDYAECVACGCVLRRTQGSWRYEFYGVEDLPSRLKPLQLRIDAFAYRFNHTRPHQALGDLTPAEYLSTISQEIAPSHMG
jgi:transposase InsO family protein